MRFVLVIFLSLSKLYAQSAQYETFGIPQDKQRHFATSVALEGMLYITAYDYYYTQSPLTAHTKALKASSTITLSAGVVKELYDYTIHKRNGTWNDKARTDMYEDMLYNILGVMTISVTIDIFK
jgi:hypothetical protein